jgi:hypothetical protein
MKRISVILIFVLVITVGASLEAADQSYEHYVEIGWMVPNGIHTGYGFWWAYAGFNVVRGPDVDIPYKGVVAAGTIADLCDKNCLESNYVI